MEGGNTGETVSSADNLRNVLTDNRLGLLDDSADLSNLMRDMAFNLLLLSDLSLDVVDNLVDSLLLMNKMGNLGFKDNGFVLHNLDSLNGSQKLGFHLNLVDSLLHTLDLSSVMSDNLLETDNLSGDDGLSGLRGGNSLLLKNMNSFGSSVNNVGEVSNSVLDTRNNLLFGLTQRSDGLKRLSLHGSNSIGQGNTFGVVNVDNSNKVLDLLGDDRLFFNRSGLSLNGKSMNLMTENGNLLLDNSGLARDSFDHGSDDFRNLRLLNQSLRDSVSDFLDGRLDMDNLVSDLMNAVLNSGDLSSDRSSLRLSLKGGKGGLEGVNLLLVNIDLLRKNSNEVLFSGRKNTRLRLFINLMGAKSGNLSGELSVLFEASISLLLGINEI